MPASGGAVARPFRRLDLALLPGEEQDWLAAQEGDLRDTGVLALFPGASRFALGERADPPPDWPEEYTVGIGWRFGARGAVPASLDPHPLLTIPVEESPGGSVVVVPLVPLEMRLRLVGCPVTARVTWRPGWPEPRLGLVDMQYRHKLHDADRLHRRALALFARIERVERRSRRAGIGEEDLRVFLALLDTHQGYYRRNPGHLTQEHLRQRMGKDRKTILKYGGEAGLTWSGIRARLLGVELP